MFTSFLEKINKLKQKPILLCGIGCFMLLIASFYIVYHIRVISEPYWISQFKHSIILFFILLSLVSIALFMIKNYKKMPNFVMALIVFVMGFLFSVSTPIDQVPDEDTHFLRAYAMSDGVFYFSDDYIYSRDSMILLETFPNQYLNSYSVNKDNTMLDMYTQYYTNLENPNYTPENKSIIIMQVIPYIPASIGMFIAGFFSSSALLAYYMGRIFNALFFSILSYFSFKIAGKFKVILFLIMCLPINLFMVGSNNADSFIFACFFLAMSCIISEEFTFKHLTIFSIALGLAIASKLSFIMFSPLLFFIPKEKINIHYKDKKLNFLNISIISVAIISLIYLFVAFYSNVFATFDILERTMSESNPIQQLKFIISNPVRYFSVFMHSMIANDFFIFKSGLIGAIDLNIPLINALTPLLLAYCCIGQANLVKKKDAKLVLGLFITAILTYVVSATGLYISWAPVTLPEIIGLQMRYFTPGFMGFVFLFCYHISKYIKTDIKNNDTVCITLFYILNILTVAYQLTAYYLPTAWVS